MIGGAKGIGIGIDFGIPNQYCRATSKPYIEKDVLDSLRVVASAYGKSNDDADRSIVKNLVDASNPFIISNAAFKLNSGFGKYEVDFTEYRSGNLIYVSRILPNSILATTDGSGEKALLAKFPSNENDDINDYKVEIKLTEGVQVVYKYIDNTGTLKRKYLNTSGIYDLPKSYISKLPSEFNDSIGFSASGVGEIYLSQIPSFEGAFVTDGIDDLITSTKSATEMLDGSNEITVVSMIHQIGLGCRTNFICDKGSYWRCNEVANTGEGKTGIYGYSSTNISVNTPNIINNVLGDKVDYSVTGDRNDLTPSQFSVVGYISSSGKISYTSSVAWYWTIIANKVLTTDQINQVIAYFNLDRTLKPDILCNIGKQGITNDNHAEFNDKLIDYSGNGRDIQMNNLAWKGGSGIAAKPFETIKDYTIVFDEARQELTIYNEFSYKVKSNTPNHYWTVQSIIKDNTSYQVTIITDKDCYWINSTSFTNNEGNKESIRKEYPVKANTPTQVTICGLNEFEYPEDIEPTTAASYVNLSYAGEVTVTFIPSCKGGLLLDGVNDFGKVTGMPIYKDYTFIIDYERISYTSSEVWTASVVSKAHTVVQGAFILMLANREGELSKQSNSFGSTTTFNRDDFTRTLLYQSKYKCGDVNLTVGEGIDGDTLWLGTLRDNDYRFFNGAIYSLMSFPYSMSEFLIERQLKKHKLGTLYPDMVEFRPVIKSNVLLDAKPTFVIRGTSTYLNAGDYVPENSQIWVSIKMNNIADRITKFTVNGKTIDIPENAYSEVTLQYGFPFVIDKSPQKISITIEQDENYVQLNPIINGGSIFKYLNVTTNKEIFVGDYIHKGDTIRFYVSNISGTVNEVSSFTVNGVEGIPKGTTGDLFDAVVTKSPQKINITIDEYIRYEDIVQPYPVLLRFNDENGNEVSWGGKFRVGSTITRIGSISDPESNLLNGLYSVSGLSLNGKDVTSAISIVEKQMVFRTTATWLLDNNEPKVILSPSRLRIPNSSYKLLGYIPDISGHGNHGVIHNSAYAERSGVNEDGSYQFDGVDDFVTIPTTVGGKQVLMKVNWQSIAGTAILYDQRTNGGFAIFNRDFDANENKVSAYRARNTGGSTYIDGILNEYIYASQLKNITHNIVELYDPELNIGTLNPKIGSSYLNSNYAQMSLYDFMLFDNISTDDKIKELNEYVGIEAKVELPPYYYDAYGKTNFDADRDSIQQRGVAVGDFDLTNNNFAYDNMSGFGGYTLGKFTNSWSLSNNSNSISIVARNPYDITLKKLGGNSDWEFNTTELKIISNPVSVKFKSDKNIRFTCDYHYYTVGGNSEGAPLKITSKDLIANEDTIITISPISQENIDKYNIDINRGYYLIYFQLLLTLAVNEEVTIEMLPLYPNGLVLDGVDDYLINENIPAFTDFTYILKRELLTNTVDTCSVFKGTKYAAGGWAFIADYYNSNSKTTGYSFGNAVSYTTNEKTIYGTKTSVNGNTIVPGPNVDELGITLGKWSSANYKKMVFYKLILYPKTIPLLQINFLKNLMEKDEIIDLNNPIFIQ